MRPDSARDLPRSLFLDIETVPQEYAWNTLDPKTAQLFSDKTRFEQERNGKTAEELWGERGGILAEFGKIVCIGVGSLHRKGEGHELRVTSFHGPNEYDVLQRFADLLNRHYNSDDHWLCAHNGKEFDFPYMARRMLVLGIAVPHILDLSGKKPWEVNHLDTMELWKFGDYKNFTSLDLLAAIFNIPTPKDDIDGSQVADVYYNQNDLPRIVHYCTKDVLTVAQIFRRYRGEPLIEENAVVIV